MIVEGFIEPIILLLESTTPTIFSWVRIFSATFSIMSSFETFTSPKLSLFELSITSSITKTFSLGTSSVNFLTYSVATEYVRKFTEEVPREKVLVIEDVMDSSNKDNLGDVKVSKDDIIENVAEKILTQEKIVGVVDSNNNIIGSIKPSTIIDTVFGGRKNSS